MNGFSVLTLSLLLAQDPAPPGADLYGDPLPKDAVARMGTARFRHGMGVSSLAFSRDGKSLASGSYESVIIWDMATGKEKTAIGGHRRWVRSLAFSPSGRTLASAAGGRNVRLSNAETGREILKLQGYAEHLSFCDDGLTIRGGAQWAKEWAFPSGELKREKKILQEAGRFITFTPDRTVGVFQGEGNKLTVYHMADRKLLFSSETLEDIIRDAAISPDGKWVAGGVDETVHVWDIQAKKKLHSLSWHQNSVNQVAFSPDGKTFSTGSELDGRIAVWDPKTGESRAILRGHVDSMSLVGL